MLTETFGHSGVFKGAAKLAYRDTLPAAADGSPSAEARAVPVTYGETVALRYEPHTGEPIKRTSSAPRSSGASPVIVTKEACSGRAA